MTIISPLPQRYVTDAPGIGGVIKARPEDFVVEELPMYEPTGEGEHLYLRIEKTGVSHGELMGRLRRTFNLTDRDIGYAGMKDKHAVTRQTISLHVHDDPPDLDLGHDRIKILWAERHRNKIKRGHLAGNRFAIRIREVDPLKVVTAGSILKQLQQAGAPGYYGDQRFGYRVNTHLLGALVLTERWDDALAELLGSQGSSYPEYQQERRELFDAGDYQDLPRHWTPADRAELVASKALARGESALKAMRAIGRTTLNFYVSAAMSAVYNRVLDERIEAGTTGSLQLGDVAFKHDSRAAFPVTEDDLTPELHARAERFELSPSGPNWGKNMVRAAGAVDDTECAALAALGISEQELLSSRYFPEGARRPFRSPLENVEIEGGLDEDGPSIKVVFDLPRGFYATMILREVMKGDSTPTAEERQGSASA